jgi:four helix bundle protein
MSKINKFEDIIAWQKSREFIKELYKITGLGNFKKDFTLKNQILSAALSIMLNIAEGFGRKSNKEFCNFLNISHGSIAEVQSALYVALDQEYIEDEVFKIMYEKCNDISKMVMSLIKYLKSNNF